MIKHCNYKFLNFFKTFFSLNALVVHNLPNENVDFHFKRITVNYKYGYYEYIPSLFPNSTSLIVHFDSPDDYHDFNHINGLYYSNFLLLFI